jgi:PAS domain S-box-containing protein
MLPNNPSVNLYHHLVEQVKDYAIFMLDPNGYIRTWNEGARRFKGWEADEIIGKHFSTFYPKEDLDNDKPGYHLKMATQLGRFEDEGWRVRKDKTRFWASVVITALRDQSGNLTGFAKVTQDSTAKLKQEDALWERTRDLESFAHTIAHDLRAPLRAVCGYSNMLLEDHRQELSPDALKLVERTIKNAHSMEAMIKGIFKYSQVITAPCDLGPVSLSQVVEEVLELHEADIQKSGAQVSVNPNLPMVHANHTLLLQVVLNLVGNALKFVAEGRTPQIDIADGSRGDDACFVVRDNGIGIAQENQARIFNILERLAPAASTPGNGVGLAIVKRAVERLDGKIEVVSTVGKGTEFHVWLPRAKGEALDKANKQKVHP